MDFDLRKELSEVARGTRLPDRILHGGRIVNVRSREIHTGDILIYRGRIAAVLPTTEWSNIAKEVDVMDISGLFVSPGFIDPHVHIESSMVTVTEYACAVVPRGTTTVAADPHEIGNVLGERGMKLMLDESRDTPLRMLLRVPGKIPAMPEELETSNAHQTVSDVHGMLAWPEAVCLAGDINPALIINADKDQLAKIGMTERLKMTVSGQSPGLTGRELSAFIAGGPEDSHVAQSVDEIVENTRFGLRTVLAYRPNNQGLDETHFAELAARIAKENLETRYLQFCTDDIHAHYLHNLGSLDSRMRIAIRAGFDPMLAFQMATINAAEGLRIDREFGSIAPGRHADLVLLRNLEDVDIDRVLVAGEIVSDGRDLVAHKIPAHVPYPTWATDTMHLQRQIRPEDLCITVSPGDQPLPSHTQVKAITIAYPKRDKNANVPLLVDEKGQGVVMPDPAQDILAFCVAERHQASGRIGRGFINGFGIKRGALATSISHDAHNLLVVGANFDDMALAANKLASIGGGYAVALDGEIIFDLPLPVAGLMSERPLKEVAGAMTALEKLIESQLGSANSRGILIALNFTCLPNIPFFGFTDFSLIDSKSLKLVDVIVKDS